MKEKEQEQEQENESPPPSSWLGNRVPDARLCPISELSDSESAKQKILEDASFFATSALAGDDIPDIFILFTTTLHCIITYK